MIPEQEYRLLVMVHRNAWFRKLRMEEGPQIVKILAELQVEAERQTHLPTISEDTKNNHVYH